MLPSAIVVFREIFEIVLITGIVIAATRDLPRRNGWIAAGVVAGFLGAGLVAHFIEAISSIAEGHGKQLFNAAVLYTASLCIGMTVLWMKHHAREMKARMISVSNDIIDGNLPYCTLSIVIAIAIFREGAEIVLFMSGMIASGTAHGDLLNGAIAGLISGLVVGLLVYLGLLKLPMKHFFAITSWMLILLVAGMLTKGTGYLTTAGYFQALSSVVWDSSWLLSEKSVIGKGFNVLIGYTSKPNILQLIVYVSTLGLFALLMRQPRERIKAA